MLKRTENVEFIKFFFRIKFSNLLKVLNKTLKRFYLAIFQLPVVSLPPPNRHTISRKPEIRDLMYRIKTVSYF